MGLNILAITIKWLVWYQAQKNDDFKNKVFENAIFARSDRREYTHLVLTRFWLFAT
jgi:hypothetical protein